MLFYSPEFLVFSLALLALLGLIHRQAPRKVLLLVSSYIFYMWWNPAFILLIIFSTVVDYLVGRRMAVTDHTGKRRLLLVTSLVANLGLLGTFKYAGFFQENLLAALRLLGTEPGWTSLHIVLPVGISFYTFQTMSYTIDLYRREIGVCRSPLDFALFVAFFPQLVAGPIVRARDFLPQLLEPIKLYVDRKTLLLILRGLAKKVLIADNIAGFADVVFENPGSYPSTVIWFGTICFTIQVYCDFSGYSDIAIGVARILGFRLPLNFNRPYFASNPNEFWKRWHISLSTWLRDYLYIPLGGNRGGTVKLYRNLMLTMLLGGLWHGANWNYILWGFHHGLLLVGHRLWRGFRVKYFGESKGSPGHFTTVISILFTQYCIMLTMITFRVSDLSQTLPTLKKFIFFDFDFGLTSIGIGSMSLFSTHRPGGVIPGPACERQVQR